MKPQINKPRVLEGGLLPAFLAVAVLMLAATMNGLAGDNKPKVVSPHAKYRGLTYGEWGAEWWKAAFAIPVEDGSHPVFAGGAFEGPEGVLFLAGAGPGPDIKITIPAGTPIFFPVINAECSVFEPDPFHGHDEASLRACANGHIDQTSDRFAVIDGVPVKKLDSYRVESPLFQFGPLPADNILGAPAETTSDSVDAGVYLLLEPLSVGMHTLHFGGTFHQPPPGFTINTTYNITVTRKGHSDGSEKQTHGPTD